MMTMIVGQDNPSAVLIPAGVVHGYQNVGDVDGIVINCPNRLYAGPGRKEEVDEIRHESDRDSIFKMDD
jgi:dTDP-4-dehydrorhamnose 3,5-epimerase